MPRSASVKIFLTFVLKKDETNIQFTEMINMMRLTPFKRKPDLVSLPSKMLILHTNSEESNLTLNYVNSIKIIYKLSHAIRIHLMRVH